MLQQYWAEEFGPTGTLNGGIYADKSYWVCTETIDEWATQNYPIDLTVYNKMGGFSNGYVPLFIVIGFQKKVYWASGTSDFRAVLRQAINDMPTSGIYLQDFIPTQKMDLGSTVVIDLDNIFKSADGAYPIATTIVSNSNPSSVTTTLNGNLLTLKASTFAVGNSTIQLRGTDGNSSTITTEFVVSVWNPNSPAGIIENFEDGTMTTPPITWTLTTDVKPVSNWATSTTLPYEGTRSAQSGVIKEGCFCTMTATVNFPTVGKVRFWVKTSTQPTYDRLEFYLNGWRMQRWSGETPWTQVTYDITNIGNNTIEFTYLKYDDGISGGSDKVWVDYVEFFNQSVSLPPQLDVPANITTSVVSSNVYINWDNSANATGYKVYSSPNPYAVKPWSTFVNVTASEYTYTPTATKMFFYIVATNGTKESSNSIIVK